jgi:hypothetical protein
MHPLLIRCCLSAAVAMAWSCLALAPSAMADQSAVIWIEAEDYAASNFADQWELSSMGKPDLLSGGHWIMRGVNAQELAKIVPDGGVTLQYAVPVASPGEYRLWARVGWFNARAELQWRLGDGDWRMLPPSAPTTNLMELGFFCEVSWADLGSVRLDGDTRLEIRYPKSDEENARMLMALDCLAFVRGPFLPDGPFRPGQTYDGPQDRQAAARIFELPPPDGANRSQVELTGLWQVARYDDPDMDQGTYDPVRELPDHDLRWLGFQVPGNPWDSPPLVFGHRLIYRTRVQIPRQATDRGFRLHFSGTNWIVSVFVNGRLAGTHKGVWVPWDLDITPLVRPGEINELAIAIKGTYYALDAAGMGDGTLHSHSNRPLDRKQWTRWMAPMYPSAKGDGDGYQYGIVNPVSLVCTGQASTEDVFVKPSVKHGTLGLEYTLRNASPHRLNRSQLVIEAVHDTTDQVEARWSVPVESLEAGKTITFTTDDLAWENPKLWWPQPNPDLYRLRTELREGDRTVDVHEQLFGFREVTLEGTGLYINGVRRNFWNWVDVSADTISSPEDWADSWRADGSRFIRFGSDLRIARVLPSRQQRLEFFDRQGIPGRLCTMIDGMFISYRLLDRSGRGEQQEVRPNEVLWENFREHSAQVARAYRNHPSVMLYQIENELVYINGMNIYGGDLDRIEQLMHEVVEAARKNDPTRPYTVGGGGDLSGRLEINAPHYPTAAADYYPDNAYTLQRYSTKIERWPWDRTKPWHVGECSFANHLEYGTLVSGSLASRSKQHARQAKAKYLRMLYGGYRWAGVQAFFPWNNLAEFDDAKKIFSDLCVIPRKQTHRLYGGQTNELLFKVMNDTWSDEPVTFVWSYSVAGRQIAAEQQVLNIEPGFGREVTVQIEAPPVSERAEGVLLLSVRQPGAAEYRDERSVPVLPAAGTIHIAESVYVYDRSGRVGKYLEQAGQPYRSVSSLDALKDQSGLLIVGPDSLSAQEAFGPGLLAFAVRGGRVICLEQEYPPAGAALPTPLRPTSRMGGYAHPTALGTQVFQDLGADDLIDWAGDHPTYQAVYQKPSQGARVLAAAGSELEFSPLVEVPCGAGVILLCQLRVGGNLGVDAAADTLLRNLIAVYGEYRPDRGVAALIGGADPRLQDRLQQTGVLLENVESIPVSLDPQRYAVAIVPATIENLQHLLDHGDLAARFQQAGGWIVVCNVDRDGIESFNRLVDGQFLLRPFRLENVTLNHNDHRLAATLSDADMALLSPEKIMHSTFWVSQDTFSGVIDATREFSRFTLPPGAPNDPFEYQPTRNDHDPYNFVNGLMADDSWRYTRQLWVGEDETMDDLVFRLRKPDRLKAIEFWNLDTYGTINDLQIIPDGDDSRAISLKLPHATQLATLELPEPVRVEQTITLRPTSWTLRGRRNNQGEEIRLVGINHIAFLRPEQPQGAIALDSVGGLVAFPRGDGGIFLNQLKFLEDDPKPANEAQKIRVLGTILGNMGVGFRTAANVAVAGVNVRYHPLDLQEYGNTFLDARRGERAWFGDPQDVDLQLLPRGRQDLADITWHVIDYATAPTPDAIILGDQPPRWNPSNTRHLKDQVAGIRVGRTADVLYFLHTAHVGGPITDRERDQMNDRRRPFELPQVMKYVLHYADGQQREIPVVLQQHIGHWVQDDPAPLPGARIAWRQPLPTLDGRYAVLYAMQANNPRPDVPIETIDLVRTHQRAVPAILGITLGKVLTPD